MADKYDLILGGTTHFLDPKHQWTDKAVMTFLGSRGPIAVSLRGGGKVTFMPEPGVAITRTPQGTVRGVR